jgi:hypothetical protein
MASSKYPPPVIVPINSLSLSISQIVKSDEGRNQGQE